MKFDYTYTNEVMTKTDPAYEGKVWGEPLPVLQHPANINYPQLIMLIGQLWDSLNPEISFVPYGGPQSFDPERGYIIYTLDNRKPSIDNTKKRIREIRQDPNDPTKQYYIFVQTFDNLIGFTAIHKDPIVAEELIEAFEDFMTQVIPILLKNGVQSVVYNRRTHDEHRSRYGEDISARVVQYLIQLQKILVAETRVLDEIEVRAQIFLSAKLDPSDQATPNVSTIIYDNYATPNS